MMTQATIALTIAALGQAGSEAADAAAAAAVEVNSIWDFLLKGGPMMIPIGLCSLVALTIFVERVVSLRRSRIIPAKFFPGLQATLSNGDADCERALEHCRTDGSPIAKIVAVGIKRLSEPIELLEKHIQEAGEREVLGLRKYLRALSVIASIAPLMGLLGTIFGMINAFQTVAMSGEALGKTELLAKGIYQAMITTAGGLLVAIPVLIAYHWISAKIEGLVCDMDRMTVDFVEQYANGGYVAPRKEPSLHAVEPDAEVESEAAVVGAATA